ncbi:hypothetical protein KVR01_001436 [Diaporthe batatas]|uniref:uncharacterized protein n=1 Tax=Diaporthe batatas TaxID=748121 RepID=UPI001D0392AA|nr:uncharacterized protein KVR01_001436 [Diaporthe batatas]KAG8168687.1 hypothetical protein KVR01_001436 [Diaporthe batatas]
MNWTEGNLNRHSRARKGKETLLRQKEHFAKVRAGLLDANVKISPPSVSSLAVPVRSLSSVRAGPLQSTPPSRNNRNGDRLMASPYFVAAHAKMAAPYCLSDDNTEDSTRQKRRKLLLKGDWVGMNVQKPIEMGFTKPGGSGISPWTAKKLRHPASKQKLRKLVGLANLSGHSMAHPTAANTSVPASLRQIKVRVGPSETALGNSSNASSRGKDPQTGLMLSRGESIHRLQRVHYQNQGRASASISPASHRSQSDTCQTPLLTTSPLLFHPVPTRPALVQLLHRQSGDSDNADSAFAQIGAERPAVPPSQAEEDDVWREFVAGPNEISISNGMGTSDDLEATAQRPVSPGPSQLGTSMQLQDMAKANAGYSPVVQGSGENFPGNNQATPDAVDESLPKPFLHLPQPPESPRSDPDIIRGQYVAVESSDKVSLVATPSSPELLPYMADKITTLDMDGLRDIGPAEKELPSGCNQEDENDMWKKFIFGESSEDLEIALEETRRDTVRSLRPSLPSTSTSSRKESRNDFITSSANSDSIDRGDLAEGLRDTTEDTFTTGSHLATAGTSSVDSEVITQSVDTCARTDRASCGSSTSSPANGKGTGRRLFHSELMTPSVFEADTGPATNNPERLEKLVEADECSRFSRPKLFIGKKMGQVDEKRQIALSVPQIRGAT